ncbi:hypothetical protein GCM10009789_27250 [Kribbella sancticallisti]|uniref:Uncharacterized protein n=1 Tax=Kribbella sancticallisti TaxID=460087 RepID=A0ABN2D8J1_9ACTN
MSTPAQAGPAELRARAALGVALGVVAPGAIALEDGRVRLTTSSDVLSREAMQRLDERLAVRAAEQLSDERLLAEAVAFLGAEIDHARGGSSPVDGATVALDNFLDVPNLPAETRAEAQTMLRNVLEGNRLTTDVAAQRLAAARVADRARELPPLVADTAQAAADIRREAQVVSHLAAPEQPTTVRRATRHRVGNKHRRTEANRRVDTPAVAGLGPDGRTPPGAHAADIRLSDDEVLAGLLEVQPSDLPGGLTDPMRLIDRPRVGVISTPHGPQHVRLDSGEPPSGLVATMSLRAGSQADPHVLRIDRELDPSQLRRVWTNQASGLVHQLNARAITPSGPIERFRSAFGGFPGRRDATAQYDEFRMLTRNWREAQLQADPASSARIEQDLQSVAATIQRKGQPVPALPWSEEARHVVAPDRTASAVPAVNTTAHLRQQVLGEITGLEKAATDQETRAAARRTSATEAVAASTKSVEEAETEEARKDSAAPERGRKLRVAATKSLATAERHTAIAAACEHAAGQAKEAGQAYQTLLAKLDAVEAAGEQPGPEVAALAQAAAEKVEAYQAGVAATLPSKDIQHTVVTRGRLPHLTALCRDLNEDLAADKNPYRFTPEVLHRRLRAETRRILSPDGVVVTVGNNPDADVTELTQYKINLRPGELREVLDSPISFDEGQFGQLDQGGFNLSTSATDTINHSGGGSLKTLTAGFPDSSALKATAEVVSPGLEFAVGHSHAVSSTATEYGLGGAVEVLNGEIMHFRSETPSWAWQKRTSALDPWSDTTVVATGDPEDAAHLDVGYGHTYTVPPPADQIDIFQAGLEGELDNRMPEGVVSRMDGLGELAREGAAGLNARLGGLDRVGYDQLRGLLTEDAPARLDEAARPGGIGRLITNGGRPIAYAQYETFLVPKSARLLSDSSPDHKIERLRVGFSGASGGQSFGSSSSAAATLGYPGTALSDLGSSTIDFGPSVKGGRNVSREDSLNTSDVAIHPSVQRTEESVGMEFERVDRLTFHRLDRDESFSVDGGGKLVLRAPANDLFRFGAPVPKDTLRLDADGRPQQGLDGRTLLRGDPEPTTENLKLPVWQGNGKGQLRGAGPALVQQFKGADPAFQTFVRQLSDEEMVPPLDANFRPVLAGLAGKDPALVASQLQNLERVGQQLARHRLETGLDAGAQGGIAFALTKHHTGRSPELRSYRVEITQHHDQARLLGLNKSQTATNLHIGSNTTVRSRGRSKGLPWSAKFGFSNKPDAGQAGGVPEIGPSYGRSSLGRYLGWATGSTVNGVSLTESTAPLAEFEVPHTITIREIHAGGDSEPLVEEHGSARISIDSELCDRGEPQQMAIAGKVPPGLLQTATWQHVDVGNALNRLTAELPAAARADSAALHHLTAFMNVRNLSSHPEMMTSEYKTQFAISPAASGPAQTVAQRGLAPRQASVGLTTRVENLRYVGSGHPVIGDINLTLGSSSFTSGTSTGNNAGIGGGSGETETSGDGWNASAGVSRSGSRSSSATQTAISGVERLNIKDGQHYQFVGDLVLEAEIKAAGLAVQTLTPPHPGQGSKKVELDTGAIMLTLPERDALQLYGRKKLDLPLAKVADAYQRLQDGTLSLDRRTAVTMIRRYQVEKAGSTDGLAPTHTDEMLADKLRSVVKVPTPAGAPQEFDELAAKAEELAGERVAVRLPDHYRTTMGAALIDRDSYKDTSNNETDMLREVQAAIGERVPDALNDPAVTAALRSDLAGLRQRGHMDDILDPAGFTLDYPFGAGGPGVPAPRNLQVRVRIVYDGPPTTDGAPDDPAAGKTENAFTIHQGYDYTEEGRSRTSTIGYGGNVGGGMTDGGVGSASLSTELSTSTTATSVEQNTRMSRALWLKTKRVERDFHLVIDVQETPGLGAETKGRLAQTVDKLRNPEKQEPPHRRVASGKMTLLVPASDINPPPIADLPQDHRSVPLPSYYFLRGIELHDADGQRPAEARTAQDLDEDDELIKSACGGLQSRGMLTQAGVTMHKGAIRKQFSAATRRVAFERAGDGAGPWTTPLPVPGHGSRAVSTRLRAELSGLRLISDPENDDKVQMGDINRQQGITQTTNKSTRKLPTSQTVGASDATTDLKASVSTGEQVTEKDSDTTGNRNETSMMASAPVVTVEMRVDFHLDMRRLKFDRNNQPTVDKESTVEKAASGVATLTMFRHEYDEMRARMEAGLAPLGNWDPERIAAATKKRVPERRVSAHEVVRNEAGQDEFHPYRPMVEALAQARKERVAVVLTMHQQDGSKQTYTALPNGTMTGNTPANGRGDTNAGYAAAFATLHPQLALLAEGRVDLRKLYDAGGDNGRFTGTVVKALQKNGIPAAALTELDHSLSAGRATTARTSPDGAKTTSTRQTKSKHGSGLVVP